MVSVAFINSDNHCSESITRLSLFDTGRPTNLIQKAAVPSKMRSELSETNFCGLGKTRIESFGKIDCKITIRNRCENITMLVVPDETLPTPMLLGRTALQKFGIVLKMIKHKTINVISEAHNKLNGTKELKKYELYFCSVDLHISEREALANTDLPYAMLKRNTNLNRSNNTETTAANMLTISNESKEMLKSVSLLEEEIKSIIAIECEKDPDSLDINTQLKGEDKTKTVDNRRIFMP